MAAPSITGLLSRSDRLTISTLSSDARRDGAAHRVFEAGPEEALRQAAEAGVLAGRVDAALPGEEVLMMVAELPTRDPEEIDGMVALQAEELSPFPVERTCVGWEVLRETDTGSRVLLALAPLAKVQALHEILGAFKVLPHRVDVDVLGRLEVLREAGRLPEGHGLLLVVEGGGCHAVVWRDGAPCALRSLGEVRNLSADELSDELRLSLMSLEPEWAEVDCDRIVVWHDGEAPAWVEQTVAGLPCGAASLEEFPPASEGVARRGLREGALDLAPEQWKREEASRAARRRWKRIAVAAAALWLLLVGSLTLLAALRATRVADMRSRRDLRADQTEEVRLLERQVRSLSQFTDRSTSALEMMQQLARSMPSAGALRIDDFRYDKEEGIVFSGEARGDGQAFYTFIEELGAREALNVTDYDVKQQRGETRFQVTAEWSWIESADVEEGS